MPRGKKSFVYDRKSFYHYYVLFGALFLTVCSLFSVAVHKILIFLLSHRVRNLLISLPFTQFRQHDLVLRLFVLKKNEKLNASQNSAYAKKLRCSFFLSSHTHFFALVQAISAKHRSLAADDFRSYVSLRPWQSGRVFIRFFFANVATTATKITFNDVFTTMLVRCLFQLNITQWMCDMWLFN